MNFESTSSAIAAASLGSAAAIAILLGRDELVDGPLGTDLVERQGRSAALLIALTCLASGAAHALGSRLLADRVRPAPGVGWIVVAVTVVATVAVVVAANPVERFRVFKQAPG